MKWPGFTSSCPIAPAESPCVANRQALVSADRKDTCVSDPESSVMGLIMDSWVEVAAFADADARLVLQVALRGQPEVLVIVEAEASLVADRLWLEELSENLCQGSPVVAPGSRSFNGIFAATRLQLTRSFA
jgi:hypothetical protein